MEEKGKHIDQYFKEQLGSYTEEPAPEVWLALEQRLEGKPRKKRFIWWWMLCLLPIAAVVAYTAANQPYAIAGNKPSIAQQPVTATAEPKNYYTIQTEKETTKEHIITEHKKATQHIYPKQQANNTQQEPKDNIVLAEPQGSNTEETEEVPAVKEIPAIAKIKEPETTNKIPDAKTSNTQPAITAKAEEKQPIQQNYTELNPNAGKPYKEETKAKKEEYVALTPSSGRVLTKEYIAPITHHKTRLATIPATKDIEAQPLAIPKEIVLNASTTGKEKTSKKTEKAPDNISLASNNVPAPSIVSDTALKSRRKRHFVAGIKAGHEMGISVNNNNGWVVSPYLQYFITPRIALMTQPALKYSRFKTTELLNGSFYSIIDSSLNHIQYSHSGNVPTGNDYQYQYTIRYDSISLRFFAPQLRYWSLDIPFMVNYKVFKNVEVYGGVNLNFTRISTIQSEINSTRKTRIDTLTLYPVIGISSNDTPGIDSYFPGSYPIDNVNFTDFSNPGSPGSSNNLYAQTAGAGNRFSNGAQNVYTDPVNDMSLGATFGVSYAYKNRWLLDVLYKQNFSKANYLPNEQIKRAYQQPYFRVSLGYRLFK